MIAATSFCVFMLFGVGIGCNDEGKEVRVIDRTCDLEIVKLPPDIRSRCVGPDKRIRADAPLFCRKLLSNERIIKKRCK